MKNVLITGGAGGIGSEIVKIFAKNSYFVYIVDIDVNKANKLVEEVGKDRCCFIKLDVTKIDEINEFYKSLDSNFKFNHIITLAGRALENEWMKFDEQRLEDIRDSITLNLLGHINIINAFFSFLKRGEGDKSILLISSINAKGSFGLPAYSAAKSGLYGFVNSMTKEFGESSIRINTISPGTVVTEATKAEPKDFDILLKGTALRKFSTSQEVAQTAYQICHSFCTMTGQDIVLDGGQSKIHNY